MVKEDLPGDTAQLEENRKTTTIMEEPSDGLHEKQKIWPRIDIIGVWERMALDCIDHNLKKKLVDCL